MDYIRAMLHSSLYGLVLDSYLVFFLKWLFFNFLTFVKYSVYAIPKNNTYIIILESPKLCLQTASFVEPQKRF